VIDYSFEGLEELIKKMDASILKGPLKKLLNSVSFGAMATIKELTPVDTKNLRDSIHATIDSSSVPLWGKVSTNVLYANYVEEGTKPHFPPPAALDVWAQRHGFESGFVVARAIARKGTKGHHMFRAGLEKAQASLGGLIDTCEKDIKGAWDKK